MARINNTAAPDHRRRSCRRKRKPNWFHSDPRFGFALVQPPPPARPAAPAAPAPPPPPAGPPVPLVPVPAPVLVPVPAAAPLPVPVPAPVPVPSAPPARRPPRRLAPPGAPAPGMWRPQRVAGLLSRQATAALFGVKVQLRPPRRMTAITARNRLAVEASEERRRADV
ncbi:PREDICTED: pistil-specific extensin-like protein [Branchiostoma belcheri]|uniref:Pistil-specific extensin-like protein n=1 Tax=Branchiostoma belcheri TaxID=7741 RepID=A0A6P4Y7P5_BRABE|nr:PREDICTED: pistil-specific extensin-like protein [Branchiostoma belcheri]